MDFDRLGDELTCKPLDTFSDIELFLQNPPAWRSLCKELQPHSNSKLKNININKHEGVSRSFIDGPETFCHFDPDANELERHDEKSLPKTLVCHDMANGYHDDSNIDGTGKYDAYTFYNWAGIDIFCYFSHHFITIPPLGWINVGHDHGVKVIGTVITEWAEGIALWDEILASEFEFKNFASALVAIAKTLKFDGWLLNIENKIAKPADLLAFVKHFHEVLHQELDDPVLIWYDSVTIDGHLNWQNALNHKNKVFFDACDGFFTNYSWSEKDVDTSAVNAGDRLTDLFIGIDVWGRNFYGGGQFNIQEAIEIAHTHGCSLAIFAPAWTHEAITLDKSDANTVAMSEHLNQYQHFLLRDRALWGNIWRYLNTKLPCSLPFKTSFCRGQGLKRRLYGEVVCPVPWYNLRHQQYQPNSAHGPHGYLLSTIEHIMLHCSRSLSVTGTSDTKGIMKYRKALQLSWNELHPVKSQEELHTVKSQEEVAIVPKSDSLSEINDYPADEDEQNAPEESLESKPKSSMKRKMKNVFKHLFRVKNSRKDGTQVDNEDNKDQLETEPVMAQKRESKLEFNKLEVIPEQNSEPEVEVKKQEEFLQVLPQSEMCSKKDVNNQESQPQVNDLESEKNKEGADLPLSKENNKTAHMLKEKQRHEVDHHEKSEQNLVSEEIKLDDLNSVDDDEPRTLRGRSMVHMSVNIQLKNPLEKTRYGLASVPDEAECLEVYYGDSFIGGSCLKINPSDPYSREHRCIRVFHCDFVCEHTLIVCVVTKHVIACEEQFLNLKLYMTDAHGENLKVVLIGRDIPQAHHSEDSMTQIKNISPVNMISQEKFREVQKYLLLNEPGFYIPVENSYNWIVRYYEIHVPGARVTSINAATGLAQGPILLGHLGICQKAMDPENQ